MLLVLFWYDLLVEAVFGWFWYAGVGLVCSLMFDRFFVRLIVLL